MCGVNTFSAAGATECSKCNEVTEYAGIFDKRLDTSKFFMHPLFLNDLMMKLIVYSILPNKYREQGCMFS